LQTCSNKHACPYILFDFFLLQATTTTKYNGLRATYGATYMQKRVDIASDWGSALWAVESDLSSASSNGKESPQSLCAILLSTMFGVF